MIRWTVPALIGGFFIDLLIGDPRWLYHPVRIIGNGISALEKMLRKIFPKTEKGERIAGLFLVILICFFGTAIPFGILYAGYHIQAMLGFALETFMCYQLLATKSLKDESMKVYNELAKEDLEGARYAVSMIVGRDTQSLTEQGVTKAAVETIAENTSDGIIAPLFYMAIGGPACMFFYKCVNTMDSMVGYKNDKYLNFGRCAAKFDDVVNYIPARLSGWLMIAASYLCRFNGKHAKKIFLRDRFNHASPNSAQTEAVMAGALDIQLAGDAYYFGKLYKKPSIGDDIRPIEITDIKKANRLLYATAALGTTAFALVRILILMLFI